MKELTIEQKAKRYDEALKWMCRLYPTMAGIDKEDAEHYFPELRESEDERIRKELIYHIQNCDDTIDEETEKRMVAWLEKQGKQSFAIRWHDVSLIPREMEELLVEWDSNDATWHDVAFYHADSKTFWDGGIQVEDVTRWCYIDDLLEKQGEKKPTDAEMKELLRTEYEKGRADAIAETQVAWSEEDEEYIQYINNLVSNCASRTTEKNVQNWLKSLKPRLKQEWSKEDEIRLASTLIILKSAIKLNFISKDEVTKAVDWVKSLKLRIV